MHNPPGVLPYTSISPFPGVPPPLGGSATLSSRLPDAFRGVTCAGDVAHSG